jgi:hypothetical protein
MLVGSLLGEVIGHICPDGVVKQFFTKSITPGFMLEEIKLVVLNLTFGIKLKLNIMSILGIVIAVYYFRWYQ